MPLKPFNYRLNYNKLTNDCQGFLKNCEKNQFIADNNRVSLSKLNFFYYFWAYCYHFWEFFSASLTANRIACSPLFDPIDDASHKKQSLGLAHFDPKSGVWPLTHFVEQHHLSEQFF